MIHDLTLRHQHQCILRSRGIWSSLGYLAGPGFLYTPCTIIISKVEYYASFPESIYFFFHFLVYEESSGGVLASSLVQVLKPIWSWRSTAFISSIQAFQPFTLLSVRLWLCTLKVLIVVLYFTLGTHTQTVNISHDKMADRAKWNRGSKKVLDCDPGIVTNIIVSSERVQFSVVFCTGGRVMRQLNSQQSTSR